MKDIIQSEKKLYKIQILILFEIANEIQFTIFNS